jgi:hypothetical protein
MTISAVMAGIIGVGSNLLAAATAAGEVTPGAKKVAIVTGIIMVAKDIQAYLSNSPITSSASPVQPPGALPSAAPPDTLKES